MMKRGSRFLSRFPRLTVAALCAAAIFSAGPREAPAQVTDDDLVVEPEEPLVPPEEVESARSAQVCARTLKARVVALDAVIFYNRLMAFSPVSMIYALERDVDSLSGGPLKAGDVILREDKRARPLVLRMRVGDCLEVTFRNLLDPVRREFEDETCCFIDEEGNRVCVDEKQPATRWAGMHVDGLSLKDIRSSGSNVGNNPSGLVPPDGQIVYTWYAPAEGNFLVESAGAMTSGEGDGGQPGFGLFGGINVEPPESVWYRSQLTAEELRWATLSIDPLGNHVIDYNAVYPSTHPDPRRQLKPILKILDGDEIFHTDLNAIVADIRPGHYPEVVAAAADNDWVIEKEGLQGINHRDRNEPFREFSVFYHDEEAIIQAFCALEQQFTLHSVRDNMAINYGTGGIGAEIISYGADQILGGGAHIPAGMAAKCNDCKYEEAFLSSWAVGDPAMVFEREDADPRPTGKAIRALYPDDPSNVHHSYINDHTRFRVYHGGTTEHHIHHLHAHQWLRTQNDDNSVYFDSQAIGPGSGYTQEITYNGSGNRNKTVGDAIFHCHFYPHFAQGMWELWRNHDVFEDGTRTLPDFELEGGTPIPALVPLPGLAMAPPPTRGMPGYPFYIPGRVGHRPPTPPLDAVHDGGLPRHVVLGGTVLDGQRGPFDRQHVTLRALELDEHGEPLELAAMDFHAQRAHVSVTPDGSQFEADGDFAVFVTNGLPPIAGAPYADPCVDDAGRPIDQLREIRAVVHQMKVEINKARWHFPQTRFLSLWGDYDDFVNGRRAPEPFFIRANTNDCINYYHTNLVPDVYEVDDFQVFTPTDVIGQHIHLVKFDVTASDGAANGWNYEDGTAAPAEVLARIRAINAVGGLFQDDGTQVTLAAEEHPFFHVKGAQTTVQRWWADPLLNQFGQDRTIRTVFTHDHFGPSTHQQAGLYAGLIIEPPKHTVWRDPETGQIMGNRVLPGFGPDGGPTSWRADIITSDETSGFREFLLEFQDFHLAYEGDRPVNPPGRKELPLPHLFEPPPVPMPEAISADDVGTFTVNYRNEPLALRIRDPQSNSQVLDVRGDLAHAYRSIERVDPRLNIDPNNPAEWVYPPIHADSRKFDPFTPIMRAYEGDPVQVRVLIGAHEEGHNLMIHGLRWLKEPGVRASGFRNNQMMGISEHFELETGPLPDIVGIAREADYLYQPSASVDGQWNGNWGLVREYAQLRNDLRPLPGNTSGMLDKTRFDAALDAERVCPRTAPVTKFDVAAVRARDVLPGGQIVYNAGNQLTDPTGLMYVLTSDLLFGAGGQIQLKPDAPIEPLVLRAKAGDCIEVKLTNLFRADPIDAWGFNVWPMLIDRFNANLVRPSNAVGLHPQLVSYDVRRHNGVNVGFNPLSTVTPGNSIRYRWYAGSIRVGPDGRVFARPIEFGATNLIPADPLKHSNKGLGAALIIEPRTASWSFPKPKTRAVADVSHLGGSFREFVMMYQSDVNLYEGGDFNRPVNPPGTGTVADPGIEDAEDSGNKAINYRTEPMWTRVGYAPGLPFEQTNDLDFRNALSSKGPFPSNPPGAGPIETPIFEAEPGMPVRFRALQILGHTRNNTVTIHGHSWRRDPSNKASEIVGTQEGQGPGNHFDIIPVTGAGGAFNVEGDYLYRTRSAEQFDAGIWGVFRVKRSPITK